MTPDTDEFEALVSEHMRSLSALPDAPPLPDPDRIWMLAQMASRHEAAATILRRRMTDRLSRIGVFIVCATWLLLEWMGTPGAALGQQVPSIALPVANPIALVAMVVLVALVTALVTGGMILGRPFVAARLRTFGLL
jgi:hypothetical protein